MINSPDMSRKVILFEKPSGLLAITGGDLNVIQKKFYNGFLKKAQQILKAKPDEYWFNIKLTELKKFLDIDEEDRNNKYYKKQIEKMNDVKVEYNLFNKSKIIEGVASLMDNIEFITDINTNEIVIKYTIPMRVRKALIDKKEPFARIDISIEKKIKSKYAIDIYELLKDYENVEIPEMSMEKFRKYLGIEKKYKKIYNLKKRVLDPAIEEINNSPDIDWEISYKLIKSANKYTKIKFIKKRRSKIKQLEQKQAEIKENAKINALLGLIRKEYRTNGLKKFLLEAIEKYSLKYIESQIQLVNSKKGIKDYIAFLKSAILDDYANYEQKQKEVKEYSEKIKKYIKIAEKIKKEKNKKEEVKEIVRDIIFAEFNLERIAKEEKNKLLDILEQIELN